MFIHCQLVGTEEVSYDTEYDNRKGKYKAINCTVTPTCGRMRKKALFSPNGPDVSNIECGPRRQPLNFERMTPTAPTESVHQQSGGHTSREMVSAPTRHTTGRVRPRPTRTRSAVCGPHFGPLGSTPWCWTRAKRTTGLRSQRMGVGRPVQT